MIVSASGTPKLIYILSYRVFIIWTGLGCQEGPLQQRSISFKKFLNNSNRRAAKRRLFVLLQHRLQCRRVDPLAMPCRACVPSQTRLGFRKQKLLAMRTSCLAEALAHLLEQVGVTLSRPLIFARRLDVVQLAAQPVLVITRHSPASSSRALTSFP